MGVSYKPIWPELVSKPDCFIYNNNNDNIGLCDT